MSIRIGILGYGNLGRGVECAIKHNPDMELVGVFTRRAPESVKILTETAKVYSVDDAEKMKDQIDVMILCGGSATDLPEQTPKYARRAKVPIVKVKAGPRVMNLIADAKIYDQILPKQEIKATVSGIYITSFKRIRGPIYEPSKKKKHFWQKSK